MPLSGWAALWLLSALATVELVSGEPDTNHTAILALYSGDASSAQRAERTWFGPDSGAGRVAFGFYRGAEVGCASPWIQASAFTNVRRAFLRAAECYPRAEYFARVNIGADDVQAILRARGSADYVGHPVRSGDLVFASGPDGYGLSAKAVRLLEHCTPSARFDGFEDSGVGECMQMAGIELMHISGVKPSGQQN